MSTLTPNMNLVLPTIGVDSGLTWEQQINSNANIIDSHTHANTNGVQISPNGLNISSDLPFLNNNATQLRSSRYTSQPSPLFSGIDIGCTYVSGVDLWYNDGNGTQIQLTASGSINATSSGISSGTASATISSSGLAVILSSGVPGNISGGSILIGNPGVSGSNYITLKAPTSTSTYNLTLPAVPAQTNVMTLSSTGVMASTTYDVVGQNMTGTGADAIYNSTGRPTNASAAGLGQVLITASSGNFNTTSLTLVNVTNLTGTLVCSGIKPVELRLINSGATGSYLQLASPPPDPSVSAVIAFLRNGTVFAEVYLGTTTPTTTSNIGLTLPPAAFTVIDANAAQGTNTYSVQTAILSGSPGAVIEIISCALMVNEI